MIWIWILIGLFICLAPWMLSRFLFGFAMDRQAVLNMAKFFDYESEARQPAYQEAAKPFNAIRQDVELDGHHASFLPAPTHNYAILCHGYGNDMPDGMGAYALPYMERGWNVLAPYAPAHNKSRGRYITMGWPERKLMAQWCEWIKERDPKAQIVIHGVSMGGTTALNTAGENPPGLVAAIGDCAYTSVWDEFHNVLTNMFKLPSFPMLNIANRTSKRLAGFSFKEADTTAQLEKTKVPVLLIHGELDTFVPYWMMDKNYQAITTLKEKISVPDAAHAASVYKYKNYWHDIFQFIERAKKQGQEAAS